MTRYKLYQGKLRPDPAGPWVSAVDLDQPTACQQRQLDAALAEIGRLRTAISEAALILLVAPELNHSNYTHDQACELDAAVCEAYSILEECKPKEPTHD